MGEARRRSVNGHTHPTPGRRPPKSVRVVPNIKLEVLPSEGVVMMMLGETEPELATAMQPAVARQLADALRQHADQIEPESRIIRPGGLHA